VYKARQPPGTDVLKDLSDWSYDEFKNVEQGFMDLDRVRLAVTFVEPTKLRDGDVVFADGTSWDPGDGQGMYVYYSGAWHKLQNTAVGTIIGSTGSVDNAVLRANGTGGVTVQASPIIVDDSGNVSGTGTVDIGNADTTLSRLGAGDVGVEGNRLYHAGGTDVPVVDGGTGASDAVTARTNLGVGHALLASGSNTNQTQLDIVLTSYTAYRGIIIELYALPLTDGVDLHLLFSTDGGSNFASTNYNFAFVATLDSGVAAGVGNGSSARIPLNLTTANNQIGNASTEGWHGTVKMIKQTNTALWSRARFDGYYITNNATPAGCAVCGGGSQETAQDTDALRFIMSSGNITYEYAVYGMH
jgi:hypothetical protein